MAHQEIRTGQMDLLTDLPLGSTQEQTDSVFNEDAEQQYELGLINSHQLHELSDLATKQVVQAPQPAPTPIKPHSSPRPTRTRKGLSWRGRLIADEPPAHIRKQMGRG